MHLNELQVELNSTPFLILGFTETWLPNSMPSTMIPLTGYRPTQLDRQILKKRWGGIAFYIRNDLPWSLFYNLSILRRNGPLNLC